jgi:hypothetical protein
LTRRVTAPRWAALQVRMCNAATAPPAASASAATSASSPVLVGATMNARTAASQAVSAKHDATTTNAPIGRASRARTSISAAAISVLAVGASVMAIGAGVNVDRVERSNAPSCTSRSSALWMRDAMSRAIACWIPLDPAGIDASSDRGRAGPCASANCESASMPCRRLR